MSKTKKQRKSRKAITRKTYTKKDFSSGDGMLTSVWGPSLWHYLHTISFNYPVKPTNNDKEHYKEFLKLLVHTLPCKYCRINLKNNFKQLPITDKVMKNRENFSKYVYKLHELVNKMLGKNSGLSYEDVRERYEHFRSRCTKDNKEVPLDLNVKEKGCVTPLYGTKSKCVIRIVPNDTKCETFQIDKKCIKKRY